MARFSVSSSIGVPRLNEHSPRPSSPIIWWPSLEPVAPKTGGWGAWSGLGMTRRRGNDQYLPSNSNSSLAQQPIVISTASRHISRVSLGWMPKPSSSMRVVERPAP